MKTLIKSIKQFLRPGICIFFVLCLLLVNSAPVFALNADEGGISVTSTHVYPGGVRRVEDKLVGTGVVDLRSWAQPDGGKYVIERVTLERSPVVNPPPSGVGYKVEYYADDLAAENLMASEQMGDVSVGTVITLSQQQLDAYKPDDHYQSGIQVGGPAAITANGQTIKVLYQPLETQTIIINHYVEVRYATGSFIYHKTTDAMAYEGDSIDTSSFALNIGGYTFSHAYPSYLTITGGSNVVSLYYGKAAAALSTENNIMGSNISQPQPVLWVPTQLDVAAQELDIADLQAAFTPGYTYTVTFYYAASGGGTATSRPPSGSSALPAPSGSYEIIEDEIPPLAALPHTGGTSPQKEIGIGIGVVLVCMGLGLWKKRKH